MQRVFFFIAFIAIFTLSGCSLTQTNSAREPSAWWILSDTLSTVDILNQGATWAILSGWTFYQTGISTSVKVEQSKRRRTLADIIRKGDFFALRNDPDSALAYYLESMKQLPDDITLKKKVANIYFSMKQWSEAYILSIQVPLSELSTEERENLYRSLFFDDTRSDRLTELSKIPWDPDDREYYTLIDTCYTGIHNCVVTLEAYSGKTAKILDLKNAMKGYEKVSADFQYRNLLLAAELYKQWQYRAASIIAREIYQIRPDYYENLKIYGFSLYELWRYEDAKPILEIYLNSNSNDVDTIYALGEIAFFLHDPLTSNLYLNNAVTKWYARKTDIERRLAYNYYTLMDINGMIGVLNYLVKEPDATEDDFAIAVHMSINEWKSDRWLFWVESGIAKFPDSDRLYALKARALRTLGRPEEAEMPAQTAYVMDGTNALAMLELAYVRATEEKYEEAKEFLERMLEVSWESAFTDEAIGLLTNIIELENAIPMNTETGTTISGENNSEGMNTSEGVSEWYP